MIVLDIASSALMAQAVYHYLIPSFGSLAPLLAISPELSAECLLSAVIMFISQLYFVRQLYIVKGQPATMWWIGIITFFAILGLAGNIVCVTTMVKFPHNVSSRNAYFTICAGLAKGSGAVTDILATTAMCIFLTSSRTGIPETNALLTKLTRFIIHRGALVTLFQTAMLISFYAAPKDSYWAPFHINVTKLYANTFFAMLNGREHLKPNVSPASTNMSTTLEFEAGRPKSMMQSRPSSRFSMYDRADRSVSVASAV
jgi:hypothetical protein